MSIKALLLLMCFSVTYASGRGYREPVTVLTYNTALLEQVASDTVDTGPVVLRADRREVIIEQLNETYADVACLQEVWFGEDVNTITDALKSKYPYAFSYSHDDSGTVPNDGLSTTPPCGSLVTLVGCLATNCASVGTAYDNVIGCAIEHCSAIIQTLSDKCWSCIRTSGPGLTEIVQRCTAILPGPYRTLNIPGLLLLSNKPMRATSYVDFHPTSRELVPRGYLEAEVKNIGQVVCTHATSYGSPMYFEYDIQAKTGISSWVEQGKFEIQTLVDRFSHLRNVFVAGDVNVGPVTGPGVVARQPEIFAVLAKAFCVDPIRQCTYCVPPENKYNVGQLPRTIDHIFFKGWRAIRKKRLFDDVTVGDGYALSDHFGLKQQFLKRRYRKYRH